MIVAKRPVERVVRKIVLTSMQLKMTIKRRFPALVPIAKMLRSKLGHAIQSITKPFNEESVGRRVPVESRNAVSMSDVFNRVHATNYWGNADSRSGSGSDLTQTKVIRAEIPKMIKDLGLKSMLDIPCGDFFWMQHCNTGLEHYIGADVVSSMIAALNERYGNTYRCFEVLDVAKDALPTVDLVLCRDLLVHFSATDIHRAIVNLKRSGSAYLLTTTFTKRDNNMDIATSGDWRPLNLQLAPISFPNPLRLINEGCTENNNEFNDKSLGLWRLADL
jgi:hypothetical protein